MVSLWREPRGNLLPTGSKLVFLNYSSSINVHRNHGRFVSRFLIDQTYGTNKRSTSCLLYHVGHVCSSTSTKHFVASGAKRWTHCVGENWRAISRRGTGPVPTYGYEVALETSADQGAHVQGSNPRLNSFSIYLDTCNAINKMHNNMFFFGEKMEEMRTRFQSKQKHHKTWKWETSSRDSLPTHPCQGFSGAWW